jgi:hypothetical protein
MPPELPLVDPDLGVGLLREESTQLLDYEPPYHPFVRMSKRIERYRPHIKKPTTADDGDAGTSCVLRVPNGDPLLKRLVAIHGEDTINRDVRVQSTVSRLTLSRVVLRGGEIAKGGCARAITARRI